MSNATEETLRGSNNTNVITNLLSVVADATSPAAAGYAVTTPVTGFDRCIALTINATLTGATGGTLNVIVETSPNGTDWYELVSFAQLSAAAAAVQKSVAILVDGVIAARGKNQTTAVVLAAGTAFGGQWYDRLRVRYIAGTSTSAGAVQAIEAIARVVGK